MKSTQLVLNLLVFADEVAAGAKQSELIQKAADLGFSKVEIRREYFKALETELLEVKKIAEANQIELFYSVPDEVFLKNGLNPKLNEYLSEAKLAGVKHIKWNIGAFNEKSDLSQLAKLTGSQIEINIENDQTQTSGTISAISQFMEAVKKNQVDVGYVYDLGNWRFVGEDEKIAAEKLTDYVRYIHVKDVSYSNGQPQAAFLDQGEINWREILTILPQDVPVAIEYPTTADEQILAAKKLLEEN